MCIIAVIHLFYLNSPLCIYKYVYNMFNAKLTVMSPSIGLNYLINNMVITGGLDHCLTECDNH